MKGCFDLGLPIGYAKEMTVCIHRLCPLLVGWLPGLFSPTLPRPLGRGVGAQLTELPNFITGERLAPPLQLAALGAEHPDVAATYNNLATALKAAGRHTQGIHLQASATKKGALEEPPLHRLWRTTSQVWRVQKTQISDFFEN